MGDFVCRLPSNPVESAVPMEEEPPVPTTETLEQQKETPDSVTEADSTVSHDGVPDETQLATCPVNVVVEASHDAPRSESTLIDKVREFLDGEDITYQVRPPREDSTVLSMYWTGKSASFKMFVDCREAQKRVLVYVESPIKVPEMRRTLAAEYLMRCNYSFALGNFELDFRDGGVRFRNGIDVDGGGVMSLEMVKQLIMVPTATMDRFFGGLMQVVYGTTLPVEAYEECRNALTGAMAQPPASSQ